MQIVNLPHPQEKFWLPAFPCKTGHSNRALPIHRLEDDRSTFSNTGIYYFGPIMTTVDRRTEKRWGIIYTCLVSISVHFDMANHLDTSWFLLAFSRFTRRRIRPDLIYSDNGTNLKAGEKELKIRLDRINQTAIANELGAHNIEWIFSPPSAPHFGGAFLTIEWRN